MLEYQSVYMNADACYPVGYIGDAIATIQHAGKTYVLTAESEGVLAKRLAECNLAYTARYMHISVLMNHIELLNYAGLYYARTDGYAVFTREDLMQYNFKDYLDIKWRGKWRHEQKLFILDALTDDGCIQGFFTELAAIQCVKQNHISTGLNVAHADSLLQLMQRHVGLVIYDNENRVVYKRNAAHVLKILQKYIS